MGRSIRIVLSFSVAVWLATAVGAAVYADMPDPWPLPTYLDDAAEKTEIAETLDTDGDGLPNDRDLCPEDLPGTSGSDEIGCPTKIDPFAGLAFDDSDHREWYERYWTGDCGGLSFWQGIRCTKGDDYWFRSIKVALAKVPSKDRGRLRLELWSLGRLVGHEWAKKNSVRKIHTPDINAWGDELKAAEDIPEAIRQIRKHAEGKMR